MNHPHLDQAREWADDSSYQGDALSVAAARVIQALPDHWIDAEKVRDLITPHLESENSTPALWELVKNLRTLLTPTLPTLADMTPEERQACQWMQCSLTIASDYENGVIIKPLPDDVKAQVLLPHGSLVHVPHRSVVPLPDLPRLEWPAQEPQPEHRPFYGPITITPPTREEEAEVRKQFEEPTLADLISPEDVPAGEPWIVLCGGKKWVGVRSADSEYVPWSIASMDGLNYRDVEDSEITLMFRLVAEVGA